MASLLDKSLDEIIKERAPAKKKEGSKGGRGGRGGRGDSGRGGGRGGRGGRAMGAPIRGKAIAKPARAVAVPARPKPALRKNIRMMVDNDSWEHDMYDVQQPRAPRGGYETGTKLHISNLHYDVSNEDIKELFEELGSLKKSAVHYDRSGRSKGTAEVVFTRKQDALAALKRYNGVRLDGQPMEIEIYSGGSEGMGSRLSGGPGPSSSRREVVVKPFGGRGGMGGRGLRSNAGGRGGGRGFGGRGGRGGGGRRAQPKSAADLDAELDSYHDMES